MQREVSAAKSKVM